MVGNTLINRGGTEFLAAAVVLRIIVEIVVVGDYLYNRKGLDSFGVGIGRTGHLTTGYSLLDDIKNFEKYLELKPNASNANGIIFTVGALYQGQKNNAKALEFYKKVQNDAKYGAQAKQMIAALSK